MKNILILRFPYASAFGGAEKQTLSLCQRLKERKEKFFLLSSDPVLLREFRARGWPARKVWGSREPVTLGRVVFFPFVAIFLFLRLWSALLYYRFFKRTKILYCLSLTEKLILTLPARILGFRVFWIEHVIPGRWLRLNPFRPLYIFNSYFARVIAVSEAVKKQLVKYSISGKRIRVIYNGIDLKEVLAKEGGVKDVVATAKISHMTFTIGTICRLTKEKGVDHLLKAIAAAQEFIPHLELVVIGDGPEKKNLVWVAKKLGIGQKVKFVGFQENVIDWINNFEIFVLPTREKESFGLVLLEAMARGKPVVATSVGGIPEVVEDKVTGLLVPPKDSATLGDALIYLYTRPDKRKEMGERGRERVLKLFTLERMVEEYVQEFEKPQPK